MTISEKSESTRRKEETNLAMRADPIEALVPSKMTNGVLTVELPQRVSKVEEISRGKLEWE